MRLLRLEDDGNFSLVDVGSKNIPRYAALSHTWGPDHEEVTYKDIVKGTGKRKAGYTKIQFCGKQAAKDSLEYFWVDTCCINKSSSAELSEAINSMFQWYNKADKCYVYLPNVSISSSIKTDLSSQQTWKSAFQNSRWFTRGWTLQELLAPKSIEFFSAERKQLGNRSSLLQEIHNATGISIQALQGCPLSQFSVDERMSWAEHRETKREEDAVYSLFGIFDVHLPLIYGEGRNKALKRLHKEIQESINDSSSTPLPAAFSEHENIPEFEKVRPSIFDLSPPKVSLSTSLPAAFSEHENIPEFEKVRPSVFDLSPPKHISHFSDMSDVYETWGTKPELPPSSVRPLSVRGRSRMQIFELEHRVETLVAENRQLQEEKIRADESLQNARALEEEVARLANINAQLSGKNAHLIEKNQTLTAGSAHVNQQLEELEQLRSQHQGLISGMEDVVRGEITLTTADRDAETERLRGELHAATEQIQTLQRQILTTKRADAPLTVRDEDYFDSACQQLCQHVQQWVLRFSEVSRTRACRLSTEIGDEKLEERLDNTILDGSDVDIYLADQVKRRDVFMSVVMNMIWEFVFTRYLFGMDREQRQKLKALEKILQEAAPTRVVAQWRAITLTFLAKREPFKQQCAQDAESVMEHIYSTLTTLLSPPPDYDTKLRNSFRKVLQLAVSMSIEMRTQRAEYIMLPPLRPEYDVHGDVVAKVIFSAGLMNENSGGAVSNEKLEADGAVVKIVLFPLVVKKGDDHGEGDEEIVVCPAQVLVAKPKDRVANNEKAKFWSPPAVFTKSKALQPDPSWT